MSQQPEGPPAPAPHADAKARKDRRVKILFLVAAAVVMVLVYRNQRKPPILPGWGEDLEAAVAQAKAEDRRVLAVFVTSSPGEEERTRYLGNAIPKNESGIVKGRYVRLKVIVPADLAQSPQAGRYKVTRTPTALVLGPDGNEIGRREGIVGELDFGQFLDDPAKPAK